MMPGKSKTESTSLAEFAFNPYFSPVGLYDCLHYRESQANAAMITFNSVEWIEYVPQVFSRNSPAGICHLNKNILSLRADPYCY